MMSFVLNGLALLALMACGIVLAAYLGQRRLLYFPDTARTPPASIGLTSVTEHEIAAPDGTFVIVWEARAKPGQPTLVYFHGNAASLSARAPRIERAIAEGWGIVMMTYRGFGGSTGSPTEVNNVADALRVFDWVVAQGVPAKAIILYGESLGTGVATQVATQRPGVAGLILDAPYTSTVDVGKLRFPFLPVELAMKDRYETKKYIKSVSAPLLIIHGARDAVIPVEMGREIARIANDPKRFVEFPNGGHIDLYINGNDALTHVRAFVDGLRPFTK